MKEISSTDFMPIDGPMAPTLSIINGFSCAFGSLGNLALIIVIILHKQLHGASEILLMSLALADFLICGIYLPLLLIRLNTNEKLPTVMNQSRRAIGQAATVCGSLNLLTLTVDRLIFFYRPLRYSYWMRKKTVIMLMILIYGISLFVGFYAYFDMIKSQYPKLALVGVPMLIFFLLHYAIIRLAATHQNQVANQEQSLQHNYNVNSSAMLQAKRNVRTVMIFGILYLLTWLPVTIFQLWRSITNYHDPESFQKYFYLLLTIQQISACIDPYLCCYRNNKVKAVFKRLIPKTMYMNKFGGSGNTTSISLSDGLDSTTGKSNRSSNATTKAAVISGSLENVLAEEVLGQTNTATNTTDNLGKSVEEASLKESDSLENIGNLGKSVGNSLDKIIQISRSMPRASPNEYESFENIYKLGKSLDSSYDRIISLASIERASAQEYERYEQIYKVRSCSVDGSLVRNIDECITKYAQSENLRNSNNVESFEDSVGKIDSAYDNVKDETTVRNSALDVLGITLDNIHSTRDCHNDKSVNSNADLSTDDTTQQLRLSESESLQTMNKDEDECGNEIDLSSTDGIISNFNRTKECSEQSEETLIGNPGALEHSLELEQPLGQLHYN